MDLGLEGRAALVTASSSGLGKASAVALARDGADVAICARSESELEDAREDVDAAGDGDVIAVPADITDPDDVSAFVDETVDAFGGIDHVVTSAGGPPKRAFLEVNERDWYAAYDLLVMSVVWVLEESYPFLVESDAASVVNITSTSVREPIPGLVLSNAVRKSVVGLMKTVAREFAPDIRVNAVLPGAHETPRITEVVEAGVEDGTYESYEDGIADWTAGIPLGRVGDPQELGDVVAFLASERASFVTGTAVAVDGGQLRS